jgi:hypothetical protein
MSDEVEIGFDEIPFPVGSRVWFRPFGGPVTEGVIVNRRDGRREVRYMALGTGYWAFKWVPVGDLTRK